MGRKIVDITGNRYGRLVVIGSCDERSRDGVMWNCRCDCGSNKKVVSGSLRRGSTKSCGCLLRDCGSRLRDKNRHPFGSSSKNALYSDYRVSARRRGVKFDITFDLFLSLTSGACYYCGGMPQSKKHNKTSHGFYVYNGIDRVKNDLGYSAENCVTCCGVCNNMKRILGVDEFISKCLDIARKHG